MTVTRGQLLSDPIFQQETWNLNQECEIAEKYPTNSEEGQIGFDFCVVHGKLLYFSFDLSCD